MPTNIIPMQEDVSKKQEEIAATVQVDIDKLAAAVLAIIRTLNAGTTRPAPVKLTYKSADGGDAQVTLGRGGGLAGRQC